MDSTLFWQPYPDSSTTKILYKSKAILDLTHTSYDVFITNTCIRFHNMCLPFVF